MTLHVSNKMLRVAAIAAATALALSACGKSEDKAGQQGGAAAGQQAPVPEVRVVTVHPQQVTISTDLPGRLESFRSAGVRAQVGGIIKKRLFQEGSYVKAGQPLYQLDDATYVASLESARAQLATAEASLAKANADLTRYKPLVAADAISKQDYDAAVASKRSGEASVKSAKAAINQRRLLAHYRADFGLYRTIQGFRRLAGRRERQYRTGDHPANQSDVCQPYPVRYRRDASEAGYCRR